MSSISSSSSSNSYGIPSQEPSTSSQPAQSSTATVGCQFFRPMLNLQDLDPQELEDLGDFILVSSKVDYSSLRLGKVIIDGEECEVSQLAREIQTLVQGNKELELSIYNYLASNRPKSLLGEIGVQLYGLDLQGSPETVYKLKHFPGTDPSHPIIILTTSMKGNVEVSNREEEPFISEKEDGATSHVEIKEVVNINTGTAEVSLSATMPSLLSQSPVVAKQKEIIYDCMNLLTLHLETEGIFRLSEHKTMVETFMNSVEGTPTYILNKRLGEIGPNSPYFLASVMKQTIKARQLIPSELYDQFIAACALDIPDKVEKLREIIEQIPSENQKILKDIFLFMRQVASHADSNKMNSTNLAMTLKPNILAHEDVMKDAMDTQRLNALVALMIENVGDIFR